MNKVIVTGGLGYIGSHTVVALSEEGYQVVIIDDLSNSHEGIWDRLQSLCSTELTWERINLSERTQTLETIQRHHDAMGIIHFAASKAVGESVLHPLPYYRNNLCSLIYLLEAMGAHGISRMIFSSSCTVYGEPLTLPVTEESEIQSAQSPYGNTKQIGEEIIRDVVNGEELDLKAICLRYFNPVGAHPSGIIGELPLGTPANLLPYIMQTAAGDHEHLRVWGDDYPTPDGTAIRDYIHVMDLAEAHVKALSHLDDMSSRIDYFNLGTGAGTSVLEMLASAERAVKGKIPYQVYDRRLGDIMKIYADTAKANAVLGWKAKRGLDEMTETAWKWMQSLKESPI